MQQAGLAHSRSTLALFGLAPILTFAIVQDLLAVWVLSLASGLAVLGVEFEALTARARRRSRLIEAEWPSVIESLQSAAQSAMSILDSMRDLGESSHLVVAQDFAAACDSCDRAISLDSALERLKANFGLAICDLTIETLRVVNSAGGVGFLDALSRQAAAIRQRSLLNEQIQAKQSWVLGTAKIAVVAPWLIVAMLASRSENVASFNSPQGVGVLVAGLLASLLALRLISLIGRIETNTRVLA